MNELSCKTSPSECACADFKRIMIKVSGLDKRNCIMWWIKIAPARKCKNNSVLIFFKLCLPVQCWKATKEVKQYWITCLSPTMQLKTIIKDWNNVFFTLYNLVLILTVHTLSVPMPRVFLHFYTDITFLEQRAEIQSGGTSEAVTSIRPIFKCGCFSNKAHVRCWFPSSPHLPASLQAFYYLQRIISVILTLIFLTWTLEASLHEKNM